MRLSLENSIEPLMSPNRVKYYLIIKYFNSDIFLTTFGPKNERKNKIKVFNRKKFFGYILIARIKAKNAGHLEMLDALVSSQIRIW